MARHQTQYRGCRYVVLFLIFYFLLLNLINRNKRPDRSVGRRYQFSPLCAVQSPHGQGGTAITCLWDDQKRNPSADGRTALVDWMSRSM